MAFYEILFMRLRRTEAVGTGIYIYIYIYIYICIYILYSLEAMTTG